MSLNERATRWAHEILSQRWTPSRFRLELTQERQRHMKRLRPLYRAEFRVWDLAGIARVDLDARGRVQRVAYPLTTEDTEPQEREGPQAVEIAGTSLAAALAVAREAVPEGSVGVRSVERHERRDGSSLFVTLEHAGPRDRMTVDLDLADGTRVGYACFPFYEGSTRSNALSRRGAVERAQRALDLPEGARLARAEMARTVAGRVWRLRWDLEQEDGRRGYLRVNLNGRTGVVCEYFACLRPVEQLDFTGFESPEEASAAIASAATVHLGEPARVQSLVRGAVEESGRRTSAWLAVVHDADGGLHRVSMVQGKVRFASRLRRTA